QDAHGLVAVFGPGLEQERRPYRALDELLERRVPFPELGVLGKLVRQAGRVRQQVLDRDLLALAVIELRDELLDGIPERERTAIGEHHHAGRSQRLRDGGEEEDRLGRTGLAEGAGERRLAAP